MEGIRKGKMERKVYERAQKRRRTCIKRDREGSGRADHTHVCSCVCTLVKRGDGGGGFT